MPAPLNLVFSSTRQWNPGDEFILFGCLNALRANGVDFNPIILNRNPQIRRRGRGRWLRALDARWLGGRFAPFLDNSLKDRTDPDCVDGVVFAGSPEWRGPRLASLYRTVRARSLPTLMLGLGTNRDFDLSPAHVSADELAVFRQARLIACRDRRTATAMAPVGGQLLNCPALLSSPQQQPRATVRRVGLIFGSDRAVAHNRVTPATYAALVRLYQALIARHGHAIEFEFVAHYIDELPHFREAFGPEAVLRYSYDAADYLSIYGRYDLVVGHRVHGIGLSASQGIPGLGIVHDARGETARGFGAELIPADTPLDEALARFDQLREQVAERSHAVLALKAEVAGRYAALLEAAGFGRAPR